MLPHVSPQINERLIFSDVLLNEGGVYDSTTGTFTAAIDGTYAFSYSLCITSGKFMSIRIVVDGREISREWKDDNHQLITLSAYAVTALTAGSEVWIAFDLGSASGSMYVNTDVCWNRFSGHILN